MQQRVYRGGSATPAELAAYLVNQFQETRRLNAQIIGQGDSLIVQIRREERAPSLTVGIGRRPEDANELVVTVGEQQWFQSGTPLYAAAGSLTAALFSPWALFGLIWPLKHTLNEHNLPGQVWSMVDVYLGSQGATLAEETRPEHPHLG